MTINAFVKRLLTNPLWLTWATGLFSVSVLGYALFTQYVQGLHPCELCIMQRWPYALIALLALFPLIRYDLARIALFAITLAFMANTGIAFYHMGVELKWWVHGGCSGLDVSGTVDDILARIQAAPMVKCDEPQWQFLGLTMATWNMVLCAIASVVCGNALVRDVLKKKPANKPDKKIVAGHRTAKSETAKSEAE